VLTWLVCVALDAGAASAEGVGQHYDDAGEGYAFLDGDYVRTRAACRVTSTSVELEFTREGQGEPRHTRTHLDIRGVSMGGALAAGIFKGPAAP
jgi:hypothetical protein